MPLCIAGDRQVGEETEEAKTRLAAERDVLQSEVTSLAKRCEQERKQRVMAEEEAERAEQDKNRMRDELQRLSEEMLER